MTYTRSDPAKTPVSKKPKKAGASTASTTAKNPKIKTKRTPSKTKVVAKKKKAVRVRKELTPEEKTALQVRNLKKVALLNQEPPTKPFTKWMVYASEHYDEYKNPDGVDQLVKFGNKTVELSRSFKVLSSSEIERLEAIATQNKIANAASYKAWVVAHTPAEIAAANKARTRLRRLDVAGSPRTIKDERQPKRPATAYALFVKSRWQSGELQSQEFLATASEIANQWKSLSDVEKKPFIDSSEARKAKFAAEHKV